MPHFAGIGGEAPPGGLGLRVGNRTYFLPESARARLEPMLGQTLTLEGTVRQRRWGGVETAGGTYQVLLNPRVIAPSQRFTGTLQRLPTLVGIGGEAPPGGMAIRVGQRTLFLRNVPGDISQWVGRRVVVEGAVTRASWGGVETPGGTYELINRPSVRLA